MKRVAWCVAAIIGLGSYHDSKAQPAAYPGVVADGITHRPLPAATVKTAGQILQTNESGRFELPARPPWLHLSCVGYYARKIELANATDTLWLYPRIESLPDITVAAQRREISLRPSGEPFAGLFGNSPGTEMAVWLINPDTNKVFLAKHIVVPTPTGRHAFREGRLLVAIYAANPAGSPPLGPRLTSWLPINATTARKATHNRVLLDVAKYRLAVPATGLLVVVRYALSEPGEQVLEVVKTPLPKHPELQLTSYRVRRITGQTQLIPATHFPQLYSLLHAGQLVTWERATTEAPWWHRSKTSAATSAMRFNRHVELVVEQLD